MSLDERWSVERANDWYSEQAWPVGCNFIPSTAINQLEMWQEDTFDPDTIARELGFAQNIGFNAVRVYLHNLLWEVDRDGLMERISCYLDIASKRDIRTMFVFFDDCWNKEPQPGKQPEPKLGIHNSGWVQSPGEKIVLNPSAWPMLKKYLQDVLHTFASDHRILMWDLYNEPGNRDLGEKTLPFLKEVFAWARATNPEQPLTAGVWSEIDSLNDFQLSASDIITFHNYLDAESLVKQIDKLKIHGRPLICTEYMARTRGSLFATCLPIFKSKGVGCFNWGLVKGKTQTIYEWRVPGGTSEPEVWFHDIFRGDGTPHKAEEISLIKSLTLG